MKLLVRRLRDTNNVVAAMSFLPLKGRVAHALLSLAEAFGNDVGSGRILIRQKVTQSDLAAMTGIARENVSRVLNDWVRHQAAHAARRLLSAWKTAAALEREARDVIQEDAGGNMTVLGSGEHRYRVVENWAKLPDGWNLTDVAAVAVDSKDRVYVFNRGEHPMVVLDRDGNFIKSWAKGVPAARMDCTSTRTTSSIAPTTATIRCANAPPTARCCSTIGIPDKPAPYMSGEPFNRCTHTALSPKGEIYVSDGYGNACVHKYTPDGKLMKTWGEPGTDPGQFNIVHNIATDADGWVYVADRENHRVQVFDGNGKYETQWNNLHRPCALCCCGGKKPNFIIGELGPGMPVNLQSPNMGPRLTIVDAQGQAHRAARRRERPGPGDRQVPRPARASRSIPRATSISARSASPTGRRASPTRRCRRSCAACRSWRR